MAKNNSDKNKKSKSSKQKLEKEMFDYYKGLNKELKNKQSKIKKQKKPIIIGLAISFIVSMIIAWIISAIYNLPLTISSIVFGIIFILLFSIADLIVTNNEDRHRWATKVVFEIFTLLILSGQLAVMVNQTNIQNTQTTILDRTSQSNMPQTLIVSSQGLVSLSYEELAKHNHFIAIGVTNIGRALIPSLNVHLDSPYFSGFQQNAGISGVTNDLFVYNLKSLEYNFTWFEFYPTNLSAIKIGENNLQFRITCPVCEKPIDYQNITFCVYNSSSPNVCEV
jgi:hypothetical protein